MNPANRAIASLTAASYWFGLCRPINASRELFKAHRWAKLAKSATKDVIFNLGLEAETWEATPMNWDEYLTEIRKGLM